MSTPGPYAPEPLLLKSPWFSRANLTREEIDSSLLPWLQDPKSLTEKLQVRFPGAFAVRVLWHDYAEPTQVEKHKLELGKNETALVREVCLYCNQVPRVFARSVIPISTLEGSNQVLKTFGAQSLGALLFSHPKSLRGEFEFAQVELTSHLKAQLAINKGASQVWGRRSEFLLRGRPLLVAEFFLPDLFEENNQKQPQKEVFV